MKCPFVSPEIFNTNPEWEEKTCFFDIGGVKCPAESLVRNQLGPPGQKFTTRYVIMGDVNLQAADLENSDRRRYFWFGRTFKKFRMLNEKHAINSAKNSRPGHAFFFNIRHRRKTPDRSFRF
jgi:hypothetical protein